MQNQEQHTRYILVALDNSSEKFEIKEQFHKKI